jgi:nicotinate phosphoribosyltransferase
MDRTTADPLGWVTSANMALLVDLYELTMADSYLRHGMNGPATFSLFARHLPPGRRFLMAAGLATALAFLQEMRFPADGIAYLRSRRLFSAELLDCLADFRFSGEVWAVPEGEIVLPPAPLLEVTAPLIEAQIVETFLLNAVNSQTMWATKAAQLVLAARGKAVVDFSPRRDHGADAAMKVARAAFVAGCAGTSNVLAGQLMGIPIYGTMAHSYVMSFPDELAAFRAYARDFPDSTVLLIDTYDTLQAAELAVQVAQELAAAGHALRAVRLDSGDLGALAHAVRAKLDAAGLPDVHIMASGDLDEERIAALLAAGAPIDIFGVGTKLGTSEDAPAVNGVYKLVEDERGMRIKLSPEKVTLPGRKQVWRVTGAAGRWSHDVLGLRDEPGPPGGRPLLARVMRAGRAEIDLTDLAGPRARARARLAELPPELTLGQPDGGADGYTVRRSAELERLHRQLAAALQPLR